MNRAAWDDLELFLHVADEGGLSGAAQRTGLSAPTIGRRMLALERTTGRALFVRSQQGYRLAHDGEILLQHVRSMQSVAETIANWHKEAFAQPIVSIAADGWVSTYIADRIGLLRNPGDAFRLCCRSAHEGFALGFRGADVAVTSEKPSSGNFAVRRAVDVSYAAYLSAHAVEEDGPRWISIGTESAVCPADRWVFQNHEARIYTWTSAPHMLLRLVRSGAGRAVLPIFVGDREEGLIRVSDVIRELDHPLHIVVNDDDRKRPELRLVIDRLTEMLKAAQGLFGGRAEPPERGGIVRLPLKSTPSSTVR